LNFLFYLVFISDEPTQIKIEIFETIESDLVIY